MPVQNTLVDTLLQLIRERDRKCNPPPAEQISVAKNESVIIVTISSFSRSVTQGGRREECDIPHPRHVYRVEFIRERCYAIGRRESIIYLGNYSEAGSTPPRRWLASHKLSNASFCCFRRRKGVPDQTRIVKSSLQFVVIFFAKPTKVDPASRAA